VLLSSKQGRPCLRNEEGFKYGFKYGSQTTGSKNHVKFDSSDKYCVFWEYGFDKLDDFSSIHQERYKNYQIRVSTKISLVNSPSIQASPAFIDIPQADDVNN
jgi:hypothetical protein